MTALERVERAADQAEAWTERAWRVIGGVSVRTKILGIVLALTILLGLGITWQVRTVMQRTFFSELDNRGLSVASDLAARSVDPILLSDTFGLYQLLMDTVANHPDALYAFVVDDGGQVVAHTFGDAGFPIGLLDDALTAAASTDGQTSITHVQYRSEAGTVHEFRAPIFDGRAGVVHLGLTEYRLASVVDAVTVQMLLTTMVVAVAGILAAILLTWLLTRPILDLVAATRRVGSGDLDAQAPHWADDEIGDLADAFNQMVRDLADSQAVVAEKESARAYLLRKLIDAQEDERRRIARELHDGVGQVLTSFIVATNMCAQMDDLVAVQGRNVEMGKVAMETLGQVRMLSRQLRPSIMDDLGLEAALERYADDFPHLYPNIHVDLHCDLHQRLPDLVEITLYRIVQEAMTNAARYSGGTSVGVLIARRDGHVQAIIEDNGCGFDPEAARRLRGSVGLHGMAERAELVGGELSIESNSNGTTIYVEIPV